MSMLSEQVKELREIATEFNLDDKEELSNMINQAADTIESLSAKLAAANMERSDRCCGGGWILCENKMPEIGKPVLVCDKKGNVCVRAITCKINGKKYWSQDKYDVVAWRPLPEPYRL